MQRRTTLLLCGIVLLVAVAAQAENYVEFIVYRQDQDNNGTADLYLAEIFVGVSGATAVDLLFQGGGTVSFTDWGDEFELEAGDYATLAGLNAALNGTNTLRVTHAGGVSDYQYTMGQVTEGMFPNIPTLAAVPGNIQQDHNFQWTWAGTADEMFADAEIFGKLWKGQESLGGSFVVGTTTSWTPDFSPETGAGEFLVSYENKGDVLAGNGSAISGWTLLSGSELFGGGDDEVLDFVGSVDEVEFTVVGYPGDADGNGVVNAADYIALKTHIGQVSGAAPADGDFDFDGDVDWDDLQVLQDHYGETRPGSGSIPEPASLSLLALLALSLPKRGGLALLRRRRANK